MDEYSNIVYRCPGSHQRPGGTYGYLGVSSKEEETQRLSEGWFLTMPEAIAGKPAAKELSLDALPTRAELEQKAAELSIKFDSKMPDKALAAKIVEALSAQKEAA